MSRLYSKLPSEILSIKDPYTSYCLNEACAYIIGKIEDGEDPKFAKKYKSFKDMYRQFEQN